MTDESINTIFNTAWEVVNHTGLNVFLTGKAGTGKTTFLKKLIQETSKNCVVVAPTGVAAINAGGVTMHSFFQLPFNAYLRHAPYSQGEVQFTNKSELLRGLRISKDKRELMQEMDLLIIDEVSMVRADMLDAVDDILKSVRGNRHKAFGGVQVLFIGDLFQLPPVVQDTESYLLKQYYESPFFFNAEVLRENPPVLIELKKIYRQTEEQFIGLLNNIRNNTMKERDYELLHSRYVPSLLMDEENFITLTTHNNTADKINQDELRKLNTPIFKFMANVDGEFNDRSYPAEKVLELKLGAQIMFIKNDTKGGGRYYNGKLAKVISISEEEIIVKLADSDVELRLEKEKWENIKYVFNKEDNKIEEQPLGSFLQYPIRLAWAITIHKSQGLTFSKMAIDAGSSFAAGQVYVALSRCTSLMGLTLLSKILPSAISTDHRIIEFVSQETDLNSLNIDEQKFEYSVKRLEKIFNWMPITDLLDESIEFIVGKKFDGRGTVIERLDKMKIKAKEQADIAVKLMERINQIISIKPIDTALLTERIIKAKPYFIDKLLEEIVHPIVAIREEIKVKKQTKTAVLFFNNMILELWRKIREIERADVSGLNLKINYQFNETIAASSSPKNMKKKEDEKAETGGSKKITLELYQQKKTIEEIAELRGMAASTIEGHLALYIESGEVNLFDFITEDQFLLIKTAIDKLGLENITGLKKMVGETISWGRLRMAVNYLKIKKD